MRGFKLCRLSDVPDGGARVIDIPQAGESSGGTIVLVRRGRQVWGYVNRCPHFSVPLDFEPGEVLCYRDRVLMCAHHSALFRFEDGLCIEGPCAGAALDAIGIAVSQGYVTL
ncbi:Rieske 2Fe-2S domain-containing protein [Burkholderia multivorans]|uniref:Rieske (2Fe-2S) protein n=1 Tax=Burkholderia multivorans TaxID=87883 RepID=UPI0019D12D47|nr:Rieske 2Fe-2S domain-containing protein [Burkholderia multivorans]MBN6731248.1 Rieske 2Fe-2S domain-containing protein [Burkholderia multivorans]MBN6733482.1 Rieske 2Fe-2S domain-containing protein [Burkholderia multivorans]MBN7130683.1 Rieske 2Fe-2S domain-containing protein [Burkholderia multivorans]MBN8165062.1 Rieske 2Fe-2S domain-containing protein [Burkholderia multivorans]MBN8170851.1 Rieske 2Fe-2S domain-containing protein [Burkholderia multivorans]